MSVTDKYVYIDGKRIKSPVIKIENTSCGYPSYLNDRNIKSQLQYKTYLKELQIMFLIQKSSIFVFFI